MGRVFLSFQCLDVRVLIDLGGAQGVSSVHRGWRRTDIGLVGKLCLILAGVDGGRREDARTHADRNLVDDAGGVCSVLDSVAGGALGSHQVGHGARGAESSRCSVRVEVRLRGEVSSCSRGQVGVDCTVAGAIVGEGIWRLSNRGSDVGLLPPVTPCAIGCDVLLGLCKGIKQRTFLMAP